MERRGGWNRGEMSERTKSIIEMRRSGKSLNEISVAFNVSTEYAGQVCRKAGMGGSIINQRVTEAQAAEYVSRSGFDYVDGFTTTKSPVRVRCRKCGAVFERNFHIFRDVVNGTWKSENECPLCKKNEIENNRENKEKIWQEIRQEKAIARKEKREAQKQKKLEDDSRKAMDNMEKRLAIHVCKVCGREYCIAVTGYNSGKYCSERCQNLKYRADHDERRIKRMYSRPHDDDITLRKLYKRDGGVCYLCGHQCNYNDCTRENGNFIAGPMYPSVDHVVPLAKGGTHTWDNVRLAHMKCNSAKGYKDISYIPLSQK